MTSKRRTVKRSNRISPKRDPFRRCISMVPIMFAESKNSWNWGTRCVIRRYQNSWRFVTAHNTSIKSCYVPAPRLSTNKIRLRAKSVRGSGMLYFDYTTPFRNFRNGSSKIKREIGNLYLAFSSNQTLCESNTMKLILIQRDFRIINVRMTETGTVLEIRHYDVTYSIFLIYGFGYVRSIKIVSLWYSIEFYGESSVQVFFLLLSHICVLQRRASPTLVRRTYMSFYTQIYD